MLRSWVDIRELAYRRVKIQQDRRAAVVVVDPQLRYRMRVLSRDPGPRVAVQGHGGGVAVEGAQNSPSCPEGLPIWRGYVVPLNPASLLPAVRRSDRAYATNSPECTKRCRPPVTGGRPCRWPSRPCRWPFDHPRKNPLQKN